MHFTLLNGHADPQLKEIILKWIHKGKERYKFAFTYLPIESHTIIYNAYNVRLHSLISPRLKSVFGLRKIIRSIIRLKAKDQKLFVMFFENHDFPRDFYLTRSCTDCGTVISFYTTQQIDPEPSCGCELGSLVNFVEPNPYWDYWILG